MDLPADPAADPAAAGDGVQIRTGAFDPWAELQAFEARRRGRQGVGAAAVFVGTMRDFNEDDSVEAMTLEHYPGMTEKSLARLRATALARWSLDEALVLHRVGPILPGEAIVLVAAWSAHRGPAFEACRFLIEELKHRAPFWKKERLADGRSRWVERNTPA